MTQLDPRAQELWAGPSCPSACGRKDTRAASCLGPVRAGLSRAQPTFLLGSNLNKFLEPCSNLNEQCQDAAQLPPFVPSQPRSTEGGRPGNLLFLGLGEETHTQLDIMKRYPGHRVKDRA